MGLVNLFYLDPILSNILFYIPWMYQKTFRYLMFSMSYEIGTLVKKWVRFLTELLICDVLRDLVPFVPFKKLTLLHGCFSRFLNWTNGTKSRNAPHITQQLFDQVIPGPNILKALGPNFFTTLSFYTRRLLKDSDMCKFFWICLSFFKSSLWEYYVCQMSSAASDVFALPIIDTRLHACAPMRVIHY